METQNQPRGPTAGLPGWPPPCYLATLAHFQSAVDATCPQGGPAGSQGLVPWAALPAWRPVLASSSSAGLCRHGHLRPQARHRVPCGAGPQGACLKSTLLAGRTVACPLGSRTWLLGTACVWAWELTTGPWTPCPPAPWAGPAVESVDGVSPTQTWTGRGSCSLVLPVCCKPWRMWSWKPRDGQRVPVSWAWPGSPGPQAAGGPGPSAEVS